MEEVDSITRSSSNDNNNNINIISNSRCLNRIFRDFHHLTVP